MYLEVGLFGFVIIKEGPSSFADIEVELVRQELVGRGVIFDLTGQQADPSEVKKIAMALRVPWIVVGSGADGLEGHTAQTVEQAEDQLMRGYGS